MKRVLRFLGKLILVLFALHLILILFFWVKNKIYLGGTVDATVSYLEEHRTNLQLNRRTADFSLDASFYDGDIFMLGEMHGFANVQKVDEKLFMHLNKKIGLRHYIAEMDSLRAKKLNTFLSSRKKDTILLKEVVIEIGQRILQQSGREQFDKWSVLYNYNQTLPDSLKIRVLGIDTDFDDRVSEISRDSMMLINLTAQVRRQHLESEKLYGLFGYYHVLQDGIGETNSKPFAAKLKKSSLFESKKITSIICHTLDSQVYFPKNPQYPSPPNERTDFLNADGPITLVQGISNLRKASSANSATLFKLDGNGSPYAKNQDLVGVKVNLVGDDVLPYSKNRSTLDFFQYLVLIRDSGAITPFK